MHVLCIDEGPAVYGWSQEHHQATIAKLVDLFENKYKFSYTIIPLEAIFDLDAQRVSVKAPGEEELKALEEEKKQDFDHHTQLSD